MNRPTIALCCIAKNEEKNLEKLTKSIEGCFDAIYLTDTGSTDNTIEVAKKLGWNVSEFQWIYDFSAARNFNFSQAKEDYVMWMDLDDILTGREGFINWRNNAMQFADYHIATYDYAHHHDGKPAVSFARERVVKNRKDDKTWQHFLHEGIPGRPGETMNIVPSTIWKISHQRTTEDLKNDKGRNITIFNKQMENGNKLSTRMKFYYGKELFEIQRPDEAINHLLDAASQPDCEPHDRLLSIQYASFSCLQASAMLNPENEAARTKSEKYLVDGIRIAHQGLNLDQHRAEFWTIIGDSYIKLKKIKEAIPFFAAAMKCEPSGMPGATFSAPIFSFAETSTKYPRNQLIRCYFNLGQLDNAKEVAEETQKLYPNHETEQILNELKKIDEVSNGYKAAIDCEDIVFTCPPTGMFDWDEEIYKTKGMGGSETACIEMAKNLKKLTGRNVIVFNNRQKSLKAESGVEYRPASEVNEYMSKLKPKIHIAWRHNLKCTNAKTYLWCHDLYTPGVESQQNFDKHICLSPFHKRYVSAMQGLHEDKIWVSRNGIVPERFADKPNVKKNPMKLIYPSSPDRGLDKLIPMLDLVRKTHPIELHVFYGFDNLYKSGPQMISLADKIKEMIAKRDWIVSHGNTEQKELTRHFMESSLWVHPANFIESFCISAIESICAGCYPITRTLGALQDTLGEAKENGWAYLFKENCVTEQEQELWANKVREALDDKSWALITADPKDYAWESVAKEWIKEMEL
jgi:glycosyltransferase involved in cell wall biosynthesis